MRSSTARASRAAPASVDRARLARAERRDALLDVAAQMVAAGEVEAVSMELVAERAGVSRALVYKHFANRHDLLSTLYERESAHLHARLSADVQAADTLSEMLRALVRGALAAQASRGATLTALRSNGGRGGAQRDLQRRRDRQTLRYFTRRAVEEFCLDERSATAGLGIALGAIPTVLAQWRSRPTPEHASELEDAYVFMVMGGLRELSIASRDGRSVAMLQER
jgi:AcrR family transcriptional regulator